jgi:hypothetical protein
MATTVCLALLVVATSCESPPAIGAFADSAQKALAGGQPIFIDIHDSCVRREIARPGLPILPLFVPPGSKNAPPKDPPYLAACTRFATESQGLTQISDVVTAYFRAIQQLSAFNTSSVTTANATAAANAATAAGLNLAQIDSVGKLASLVTQVFTENYQRRRLYEYLRSADPRIADVTAGLDAVTRNYLDFLGEEQQTITARYQSVSDTNQNAAVLLLLNRAYLSDVSDIERRRAGADAYRQALQSVRDGHHKLVQSADHLSARELDVALQPYTSKLNGLVPVLQKSN